MVGVLGCMAERLKQRLLDRDKLADLVVGPDAYRDLPRIMAAVEVGAWRWVRASRGREGGGACSQTSP